MRLKQSRESEVVQSGDVEHGVSDPVALRRQSRRIFQVFMRAKTCSTRGPDLFVRAIVLALPARQLFARGAAVGHEVAGARIAAVGHREGPAHGGLRSRFLPCPAVVAIAGQGLTDHNDQAGIRVNDDLVGWWRTGSSLTVQRCCGPG